MQIQGPLKFSVAAAGDASAGYELFLDFSEAFRQMDLAGQVAEFRNYLDEHNRQGMLVAQQIAEQLLPHVEKGELELDETINIHVRPGSPQVSLVDLVRQAQE